MSNENCTVSQRSFEDERIISMLTILGEHLDGLHRAASALHTRLRGHGEEMKAICTGSKEQVGNGFFNTADAMIAKMDAMTLEAMAVIDRCV